MNGAAASAGLPHQLLPLNDRILVLRPPHLDEPPVAVDQPIERLSPSCSRRIVKRDYFAGGSTNYVRMIYRGDHVIAETDSVGASFTLAYVWGLGVDNLVAIHSYTLSADYYVAQDQLHSVRGLTKKDGTWLASWRYRIYGYTAALLDSAGAAPFKLRYRWTGREYDVETGLYYFRARYYDPAVGRFMQEDPIGFGGGRNLYAYGDGNPTNGRDPSGLSKNYELTFAERVSSSCGPTLYFDGAPVGCSGGRGHGGFMSGFGGNSGSWANPMGWSPLTTLEMRAALTTYYNFLGALDAAQERGAQSGDMSEAVRMVLEITNGLAATLLLAHYHETGSTVLPVLTLSPNQRFSIGGHDFAVLQRTVIVLTTADANGNVALGFTGRVEAHVNGPNPVFRTGWLNLGTGGYEMHGSLYWLRNDSVVDVVGQVGGACTATATLFGGAWEQRRAC